ncbi:hypothetical protein [Paenibacillus sp. DMB5]|uniref:hypothetical protein n=1 Tax=Paenibacillus sp. DMB5 TaxID=1780103 RepID=UPI000FE1438D|nr:hypothetical protein [Paenibacillus sp. DMB5]
MERTFYCETNFAVKAISVELWQEQAMSGTNIRVANISPEVVSSELLETTTESVMKAELEAP